MKKTILIGLIVSVSLFGACSYFDSDGEQGDVSKGVNAALVASAALSDAQILEKAQAVYNKAKADGVDFSKGPCLGLVVSDWVLDIAHNPRFPIDNRPANQCAEYRSGQVAHLVELNLEGELIKMR